MATKQKHSTNRALTRRWALLLAGVALLLLAGSLAAFPDAFSLEWWTAGGGGTMSGGDLSLSGATGQADAGQMSGGTISLSGGYWNPAVTGGSSGPTAYRLALPVIVRGP